METIEQNKPKVVVIDSLQSWESYVNQASNQNSHIVVHFTASWCMPSVAMISFFEELALDYPDLLFLSVDVDEVKEVATKNDIKAMPTFLLLKDGAALEKIVGANPEELKKRIDGFSYSPKHSHDAVPFPTSPTTPIHCQFCNRPKTSSWLPFFMTFYKPDRNKNKSKEPTVKNKGNCIRNIYTVVAFCAGNKVYLQTTNELFETIFWRSKKMTIFDAECCIEGIVKVLVITLLYTYPTVLHSCFQNWIFLGHLNICCLQDQRVFCLFHSIKRLHVLNLACAIEISKHQTKAWIWNFDRSSYSSRALNIFTYNLIRL
ncbi:unnamed protein product [Vicia faba]|uniref:Thioredoxin domain-containing protein n=1 Tax=Vicia faba TaxID=3906 RepID=A0AAV0Z1Q6_VICFA|nr:unnamed protein product [Vicia faba]